MRNFAVINLSTLVQNALAVKSKLKNTKFCAVVKADGYGHGAEKCANALYKIADCFAVAILEEAVSLRLSGIDKDILVLNPVFDCDLYRAVNLGLTLTVCNAEDIKKLSAEAKRQGKLVKVHFKYNTGMNRYGIDDIKTLKQLINLADGLGGINIDGVYSHFACPEDDKLFISAKRKFAFAEKLVKSYNHNATAHISSSGGFIRGAYLDMVRIGILLYGYKPFSADNISVKPIMKLYAPVTERRFIDKGKTALYGKRVSEKDREISLIRYGYADGLDRSEVDGIFNNRCMDITAVDGVIKGKWMQVFEDADITAKKYNTISYEVLTKCAIRAEKIYIK